MAKLTVKIDDQIESLDLDQASKKQPSETIEKALDNSRVLHNIIDENLTINDPGFLDLSQLSALQSVSPQAPGSYPIPATQASFSAAEKESLENIIKKLASYCHNHSMASTPTGTSAIVSNCSYMRSCAYYANNSFGSRSDNCDDNGNW